jgi:HK97 family phage portal protein
MKFGAAVRATVARAVATISRIPDLFTAVPRTGLGVSNWGWTTLHRSGGSDPAFAFQQDWKLSEDEQLANWAVYASIHRISADIGKLRVRLVKLTGAIWVPTTSTTFSLVLRRPNTYQTWQQFITAWLISKLRRGNTYVLKDRDQSNRVKALHVLDPSLVTPVVTRMGDVYYRLSTDHLAGIRDETEIYAPASEIIHDRGPCLFHPLVGVPPVFACGVAAAQGLRAQEYAAKFFANMSRPSGVLVAPGEVSDANALRLKEAWEQNFSGQNIGRVAILGNGLKYEKMADNAEDSQLASQLKLSAEMVATAFGIPAFKIGVGALPAGMSVEDMNRLYFTDALQDNVVAIETLLDEGLGLDEKKDGDQLGVEIVTEDLMAMNFKARAEVLDIEGKAGLRSINEGREKLGLPPVVGGESPMIQQQNYSIAALAKRDAKDDPFATAPAPAPAPGPEDGGDTPDPDEADDTTKALAASVIRQFQAATNVPR